MRPQTFAFVHIMVAAAVLAVGVLAGLVQQLELFEPGMRWSVTVYSRALSIHGLASHALAAPALAGCCGYVMIAKLVGAERLRWHAIAWVGLGLWVIGLLAAIVFTWQSTSDSGWSFYTPYEGGVLAVRGARAALIARVAFGASGLVYAIHLALIIRKAPPIKLAFAIAFVAAVACAAIMSVQAALAVETLAMWSHTAAATLGPPAVFAALVLATAAVAGDAPNPSLAATALACAALTAVPALRIAGLALVGLWVALALLGGARRAVVAFVLGGCAPALVLVTIARVVPAPHADDTYVMVGAHHALTAVIAFAMLASFSRSPRTVLAWIGTGITMAGFLLHILASFQLGSSGMPRRYVDYEPGFTYGHRLAGIGAGLAVAGLVMLVLGWLGSRPAQRPR